MQGSENGRVVTIDIEGDKLVFFALNLRKQLFTLVWKHMGKNLLSVPESVTAAIKKYHRLSRACIVHLVIKRTNVKTMSCSGSHLGIPINIKKHKVCKGPSND